MSECFQTRLARGMEWDDEVSSCLSSQGYAIGRYNIENTAHHFTKHPGYATANNPSIRFVRHFPDGVASDFTNNIAFFWDAKVGKTIEKDAYETYLEVGNNGREFYLFINSVAGKFCVPIDYVSFVDSHDFVSKFKDSMRMPVDDDGWIAPRMWPEDKYRNWKRFHPSASGTPFRYFNFDRMDRWRFDWQIGRAHV